MNNKLYFYEVNKQYTEYLARFDKKVPLEHENRGLRKFVGIVLDINGIKYYAPMSSPKPKHKNLSPTMPDLFKIKDGEYGVINLNNMIPVPDNCLTKVVIRNILDEKYKLLLSNQYREINNHAQKIRRKAEKLYHLINSCKNNKLKERCCQFKYLEKKMVHFKLELKNYKQDCNKKVDV